MSAALRWNNSSLTALQKCGEAFRRRYIEGEGCPPAPRMVRGTAVHRVARRAFQRKLAGQALPTAEEARDLAASAFDAEVERGVTFSEAERVVGERTILASSKDFAVDLAAFHVETVAPAIDPVAVERQIVVKPQDSDLEIHGTLDLVAWVRDGERPDGAPGQVIAGQAIRDLKTSEKSPARDAAELSQQLTYYAMIRRAEMGVLPELLALDHLVRTPARAEKKYIAQTTTRDDADVAALVNRINTAVEAVQRGVFVPANPTDWWCSAAWCEFHGSCVYVRRGARATA